MRNWASLAKRVFKGRSIGFHIEGFRVEVFCYLGVGVCSTYGVVVAAMLMCLIQGMRILSVLSNSIVTAVITVITAQVWYTSKSRT